MGDIDNIAAEIKLIDAEISELAAQTGLAKDYVLSLLLQREMVLLNQSLRKNVEK